MARCIIRFSLDGDYGSKVNNQVRKLLEGTGFARIGTSSFEIDTSQLSTDDLLDVLIQATTLLRNLPGARELDHLWVYLDQPTP